MKAMIFAAGLGTRLKPFTDKHPKALATVNDKTLLEHAIVYLQKFGINDIVVNVHHFADQIEQVIVDNNGFGSWVTISDERAAVLETGGGLKFAAPHFEDEKDILVMNVDVLTNLDLSKLIAYHQESKQLATLAVMDRASSRKLLFNQEMNLCGWQNLNNHETKISRECKQCHSLAFSGIQIISTQMLNMPFEGKFSIIDVYLHYAKNDIIKGFDHTGNIFIDVGKPESLAQAAYLFD